MIEDESKIKEHLSLYDKKRKTVGAIYTDAIKSSNDSIVVGDMTNELQKSLIEDINDALTSPKAPKTDFYLMVHEKKDLQMRQAILRRMLFFVQRPYPEDDTIVFWKSIKRQELRFCWCLPHWSEMDNMLAEADKYDPEMIGHIKAWKAVDLRPFGFYYDNEKKWQPNPNWKDKPIEDYASIKKNRSKND